MLCFLYLCLFICFRFASAIAILGNVSEMYNYGTQYVITLFALIVEVPMTVYLLLPVFRELKITSIYEVSRKLEYY
jgi:Na+/proline symporter